MAERRERRGAGLSFGQLITLTFGFLLASLFIFVFGFWVGHDLADQRAMHQRQPLRVPLEAPPTPVALAAAPPPATPAAVGVAPAAAPTRAAPVFTPTAVRWPPTPTEVVERATPTRRPALPTPTVAGGNWTVQAYATNDTVRAVMLARTLRAKGYDASTGTKQVGSVTWYTVKVGRFRDRAAAKAMEHKLRDAEGLEAASVVSQ